jgi:hypothetical protein
MAKYSPADLVQLPRFAAPVPKAELERLGISHTEKNNACANQGVHGMKPDVAQATVAKAIQALKDARVAAPVRIPWGGR